MMRRIKLFFWWFIAPALLAAYTAAWLMPATWWYQPVELQIANVGVGEVPVVKINRSIKRSFDGRYTASVWREPPDGHMTCGGSDELRYRGGLYAPHEMSLTHWTDDPWCGQLTPGKYYAEGCWTILRPFAGIVPAKTICHRSNLFTVLPPGE